MFPIMFKEQENDLNDFKWIRCIFCRPSKYSISNPKAVKLSITQALSDFYIQVLTYYQKENIQGCEIWLYQFLIIAYLLTFYYLKTI